MLVSALPPDWRPDRRARFYLRAPRLLSPLFLLDVAAARAAGDRALHCRRLAQRSAVRGRSDAPRCCARFSRRRGWRRGCVVRAVHVQRSVDAFAKPAMVITGEPGLDRVVRPELTRRYLDVAAACTARRARPAPGHSGVDEAGGVCRARAPLSSKETWTTMSVELLREIPRSGRGRSRRCSTKPSGERRARRASSRIRIRCTAERCTPKPCTRRPRRWRGSASLCCGSTSAASAAARERTTAVPGEMDDYRAALDFMAGRYPGLPLWAAGFSFGSWVAWNVGARRSARRAAARHRAAGGPVRLLAGQLSDEGQVPDPWRARRARPAA